MSVFRSYLHCPSHCLYYLLDFAVIMKAFFVLALAAAVAAGPLCTTSTSSSVAPVATPKPKTCNRICGDATLVCTSPWVCLLIAVWNGYANAE